MSDDRIRNNKINIEMLLRAMLNMWIERFEN